MIEFTKMHGTGNDYIYIHDPDGKIKNPGKLSITMSDRHRGIGSDGLILILRSAKADFRMRMFNSDGSEAEMCGNGIRCFAKYVFDRKLTDKKEMDIETAAGIKHLKLNVKNDLVSTVMVDMGEPILERSRIPMTGQAGTVIQEILHLDDGARFNITAVSMGNPHVVIYVEDVKNFPVNKYGPMIENHDLFPSRTNVEFVQVLSTKEVIQRTWERGAGETMACGTGASAVTVAGVLADMTVSSITVHLAGGKLRTEWKKSNNHVYLNGPAVEVYRGYWPE